MKPLAAPAEHIDRRTAQAFELRERVEAAEPISRDCDKPMIVK
jgi:hypothetical protein